MREEIAASKLPQEEQDDDYDINSIEEHEQEEYSKVVIVAVLDNTFYIIFISIVTLYALMADDVRSAFVPKDFDIYFYIVTIFVLILFSFEILLSSYAKKDYIFSFFFWLDIISTASLLFDIGWFSDIIFDTQDSSSSSNQSASQLASATKNARIGTRAARIIRIIRLIRLIRIIKLYKAAQAQLEAKDEEDRKNRQKVEKRASQRKISRGGIDNRRVATYSNNSVQPQADQSNYSYTSRLNNNPGQGMGPEDNQLLELKDKKTYKEMEREKREKELENLLQETQVGKKLSDKIRKIVISLILLVMFSIPLFSIDTYVEQYTVSSASLKSLEYMLKTKNQQLITNTIDKIYSSYQNYEPQLKFIYAKFDDGTEYQIGDLDRSPYRSDEFSTISIDFEENQVSMILVNKRTVFLDGILGIARTIFVCIILAGAIVLLNGDSETMVIRPIQEMLKKVNRISEDPLQASKLEEEDANFRDRIESKNKAAKLAMLEKANYEPAVLQKVIIKIGALLAIGFGEAGSRIIAENMKGAGDYIDPMLPGQKMYAIFGFCDIRHFSQITEVLKKEVMIFVNEIAKIVHQNVAASLGAPNKNIGDAFLLVWKIPEEETTRVGEKIECKSSKKVSVLADMALYSFLKIIAEINKSQKLEKYGNNAELNAKFNGQFKLNMGFGLHMGWAIEGAVGSVYKMDATYLSPNVNMSARLEAATRQFGLTLLLSGVLQKQLSPFFKDLTRMIDRVTVKGSIQPLELYTVDLELKRLAVVYTEETVITQKQKRQEKVNARNKRKELEETLFNTGDTMSILRENDDISQMRTSYKREFYDRWKEAMDQYLALDGDWSKALKIFKETRDMLDGITDGPSSVLINYIENRDGIREEGWKGYRKLTSKQQSQT